MVSEIPAHPHALAFFESLILPCFWRGGKVAGWETSLPNRSLSQVTWGLSALSQWLGGLEGDLGYCIMGETAPPFPGWIRENCQGPGARGETWCWRLLTPGRPESLMLHHVLSWRHAETTPTASASWCLGAKDKEKGMLTPRVPCEKWPCDFVPDAEPGLSYSSWKGHFSHSSGYDR